MAVSCRDILELPGMRKARVVAGTAGLDRILRWVHVLDVPDINSWAEKGDLLLISGLGLNGNTGKLALLIRQMHDKQAAGLIIALGEYIQNISNEVLELANVLQFPIISLPWEVRFVDVTHEIGKLIVQHELREQSVAHLLEQLLFGHHEDYHVFLARASHCGYNLERCHQIIIFQFQDNKNMKNIKKEAVNQASKNEKYERVFYQVRQTLFRHSRQGPAICRCDSIIAMVPVVETGKHGVLRLKELATDVVEWCLQTTKDLQVYAGIGTPCYGSVAEIRRSFHEADYAVRYTYAVNAVEKVCAYENMGIFKLIMSLRDNDKFTGFCTPFIQSLREYDLSHGSNLIESMLVFLEENGNVVQASKRLYVHRNTLQNRIQKTEELTSLNLSDAQQRLTLHLALLTDMVNQQFSGGR